MVNAAGLIYADSSILVARLVRERGTDAVVRRLAVGPVVTSTLSSVEVTSALVSKHRGGDLSRAALERLLRRHAADRETWTIVELTTLVLSRAEDVLRRARVRTADAIHIASALLVQDSLGTALPFITVDARQREGAAALGLAAAAP